MKDITSVTQIILGFLSGILFPWPATWIRYRRAGWPNLDLDCTGTRLWFCRVSTCRSIIRICVGTRVSYPDECRFRWLLKNAILAIETWVWLQWVFLTARHRWFRQLLKSLWIMTALNFANGLGTLVSSGFSRALERKLIAVFNKRIRICFNKLTEGPNRDLAIFLVFPLERKCVIEISPLNGKLGWWIIIFRCVLVQALRGWHVSLLLAFVFRLPWKEVRTAGLLRILLTLLNDGRNWMEWWQIRVLSRGGKLWSDWLLLIAYNCGVLLWDHSQRWLILLILKVLHLKYSLKFIIYHSE
jgi:hypothetical protein